MLGMYRLSRKKMSAKHFINDIETFAVNNPETPAMLGEKNDGSWKTMNWKEVWPAVRKTALALIDAQIGVQHTVALYAPNSPEWTIVDIASQMANTVLIPLHAVGNRQDLSYILDHSAPSIIFVGGQTEYDMIMELNPASVTSIIVFDVTTCFSESIHSLYFDDFISIMETPILADLLDERRRNTLPDDLFTIVYTSGTTGIPKGVMLTHANFDFQVEALEKPTAQQELKTGDISISFLPLSHIYERLWNRVVLYYGYSNAYLSKPAQIIDAAAILKPETFCSVPKIFEKIHSSIQKKISSASPITAALVKRALKSGQNYHIAVNKGHTPALLCRLQFHVLDWLILKRIRNILGGHVRYAPCGGAPLSAQMQKFFCGLGITIRSGYGLTETCGSVSSQDPDDYRFGSSGKPMKGIEVKIGDTGEILLKGGNVMKGYYKDPSSTQDAFTDDGYLKTGDIGTMESNGEIRITDRIKDLMKTSGGKYIAPQPIEALFTDDIFIEKIALIADQKDFVAALIEPNKAALIEYAKAHKIDFENYESLLSKTEIFSFFSDRIKAKTAELSRHEKIKKFALITDTFSIEKGDLTPSLKLKRKAIAERYHDIIESLYKSA
jgi:long-chain acyl-CoA synthetase